MTAGQLRDRVSIQAPAQVGDGGGGVVEGWENVIGLEAVRGYFRPERGAEKLAAGRLEDGNAGVLRLRSSAASRGITARHRAVINGVVHAIVSPPVNIDRRNRYVEMTVRQGSGS